MDRKAIATAVAKVIAYVNCGKPTMADEWFRTLAGLLGRAHMLAPIAEVKADTKVDAKKK